MLESCHKLQLKSSTITEFKDALQLIWSALAEKAINNADRHWPLYSLTSRDVIFYNKRVCEFCSKLKWIVKIQLCY